MAAQASKGPFSPVAIALMLVVGLIGFAATLVLGAFAPDLRSGRNGGAHALSDAATGYSGIVRLLEATGRSPQILRSDAQFEDAGLLVITPERGATSIDEATAARTQEPLLIVLPKWSTVPDEDRRGWVRVTGTLPLFEPQGVMAPATRLAIRRHQGGGRDLRTAPDLPSDIRFRAPRRVQVIAAHRTRTEEREDGSTELLDQLVPLITDGRGGVVLGRFADRPTYVLADPDLIANHGIADINQARAAVAMLDYVAGGSAEGIAFDVTLNGLGRGRNVLKLFFEPPVLAMTLAVAAALSLAGWQALTRFGAPAAPERALAFGKRALIDNTAALVRKAGRESRLGARYADAIRARARELFGVPPALGTQEADAYLDRSSNRERFSELAGAVARAEDRHELLRGARRLHEWMEDRIR